MHAAVRSPTDPTAARAPAGKPPAPPLAAPVRFTIATAPAPGAIGIVQLYGAGAAELVERWTGVRPAPRCRLVRFADIDEGLIAALRDDWCQIMPHGGPRVMQRLSERLVELGAAPDPGAPGPPARTLYPEAATDLEADMLHTLARAASPAAIDLLIDQPRLWAEALADPARHRLDADAILRRGDRLDRLVDPPTVVLVGRANVGKSTLSNLVMGRAASITADLPGTTRDWVAGLAELPVASGELAVRWFDTPGLRRGDDPIEQRAIELARQVVESADVLIAITDPATDWPDPADLPRPPDLRLLNKADLLDPDAPAGSASQSEAPAEPPLRISALHGEGLDDLAAAIADVLGLPPEVVAGGLSDPGAPGDEAAPWAFSPALRRLVASRDIEALRRYAGL